MLWALTLLLGVGWAWRRLGLREWSECLPIGLALSQAFLLLGSNAILRGPGWSAWPVGMAVLGLALGLALGLPPAQEVASRGRLPWPIAVLSLASLLAAVLFQSLLVDDDYWIHTPTQGMLLGGDFPPHNLFYPGVELKGHYARDLLIALWSRMTGWSIFASQFQVANLCQMLQPLVFYWAFRRLHSQAQAVTGTLALFVGVQVAHNCGLLFVLGNNNPLVHLQLALILYGLAQTWSSRKPIWAAHLGVLLGGYAIVYETHFGLCCLACALSLPAMLKWSNDSRRILGLSGLALGLAVLLSATQGGPVTDLVQRRLHPTPASDQPGIGLSTQTQHVQLHFPKKQWLQLRCHPQANSWVESLPEGVWIYRSDQMPDPEIGYVPCWDSAVLGLHSLPLFVSPLVLAWAWRGRHLLALWLVAFGWTAFLIPATVSFGPVFESEYLRWEFAAGLAWAAALGLALGDLLVSGPYWRRGLVLAGVLLQSHSAFLERTLQLRNLWRGNPRLFDGGRSWVTSQPELDFHPEDWEVALWLREHAHAGEVLLVDPLPRPHQVAYESTMTGLTGLWGSRRLPLDTDVVGLVPSRQRADVQCFLASGDPAYLDLKPARWALRRREEAPAPHPQVRWEPVAPSRWVGEVTRVVPNWPVQSAPPLSNPVTIQGLPELCDEGNLHEISVGNLPPGAGRLVVTPRKEGQPADLEERVPLPPGQRALWRAPLARGKYRLELAWWDEQGLHPLPDGPTVEVDTTRRLAEAHLIGVKFETDRDGVNLQAELDIPLEVHQDYFGCLRLLPEAEWDRPAPDYFHHPLLNEWRHPLQLQGGPRKWRVSDRQGPVAPGRYRVEVILSPFHGTSLRLQSSPLEVSAP